VSALGDKFRNAAEWLEKHRHCGCCIALKNRSEAIDLFRSLFLPDTDFFAYWWNTPPKDHLARLIAFDLAALIADEDE
jgi:hypothetical protein